MVRSIPPVTMLDIVRSSRKPSSEPTFKTGFTKKPRNWRFQTKPLFKKVRGPLVDVFHEAEEVLIVIDLVITDMTMPHMAGGELAKEPMKTRPDIPIILCTGFIERISEESVVSMGIRGFLQKPFSKQKIANMVRKVLDEK